MPGVLLCCLEHGAHRGAPLAGVLLCGSVRQAFDGPASLLFSCRCCILGERGYGDGSTLHMTQQYRFASMATRLSSTGISHHNLLPHIASIHLSTVNSSPCPGIAPQFLNSISQPLHLPGESVSLSGVCMAVARTV